MRKNECAFFVKIIVVGDHVYVDLCVCVCLWCRVCIIVPVYRCCCLFAEPEGYHFGGAANGPGQAVWRRNTAEGDVESADDDDDVDVDEMAFGFMTWQSNATLLHYSTRHTPHTLHVRLVSLCAVLIITDHPGGPGRVCCMCVCVCVCVCVEMITVKHKNSSGDEIANVNFCTTTTYMQKPAPTPIEPTC